MKRPEKLNAATINEIKNIVKCDAKQTNPERANKSERFSGGRPREAAIGEIRSDGDHKGDDERSRERVQQ
jgi:hypothetical protein